MKALLGSVLITSLILVQPSEKTSSDKVDTKEFSYETLPQCSVKMDTIITEDPQLKKFPVAKKKKPRREIHVTF